MASFLIEVPHESDEITCVQAVKVFLDTGAHFFTRASWGCKDGEHRAWLVVDVESKDQARAIIPPAFRPQAKIVELNSFTREEIDDFIRQYKL